MPLDVDVNDRTRTPCKTPGCNWPNFHVCLVGKEETNPDLLAFHQAGGRSRKGSTVQWTDQHYLNVISAQEERWERHYEALKPRDEKMIARYAEEASMLDIQKEFGVSRNTVMKVLHKAQREGKIKIRPRGHNLKKSA